jgi:hypothetical protein
MEQSDDSDWRMVGPRRKIKKNIGFMSLMMRWCLWHISTNETYIRLLKIEPHTYKVVIDYLKDNILCVVDNFLLKWDISRDDSIAYLQILIPQMNQVSRSFTYCQFEEFIRRRVAGQLRMVSKMWLLPQWLLLIISSFIPYNFPLDKIECYCSYACNSCGRHYQVDKEINFININFFEPNEDTGILMGLEQKQMERELDEKNAEYAEDGINYINNCRCRKRDKHSGSRMHKAVNAR